MRYGPMAQNPLQTREDLREAVRTLYRSVEPFFSPGHARVSLGQVAAHYPFGIQEMEGFCRLLWGIAPLLCDENETKSHSTFLDGLVNGSNPRHPEFWGYPGDHDQRIVEFAPIAYSLLIAPRALWAPLSKREQAGLATYLYSVNACTPRDNNWLFFRVLVNLALALRDARYDSEQMKTDLDRLESFYLGNGWYGDGPTGHCDYYSAFSMQFYSLLYARFGCDLDGKRCSRFKDRALEFGGQFAHWFAPQGQGIPYGRSLIYRFGQAAFWGALAFADDIRTPWGSTKGLLLRHLRWWMKQPLFSETGLLMVGYAYPNTQISEIYNSSASPYWAMKSFLPIALPSNHPFWEAPEETQADLPSAVAQIEPRMILCRDRGHVFALAGGLRMPTSHRHAAEKYSKFSYSTLFGFSVPNAPHSLAAGAHDSMLALSRDGEFFRVREITVNLEISDRHIRSEWSPWEEIGVITWLVPVLPWYVRVHRVRTSVRVVCAEGGFALDLGENVASAVCCPAIPQSAAAVLDTGFSIVSDLCGVRQPRLIAADPNTNILNPRTIIPTLVSDHQIGDHWLACSVAAGLDVGTLDEILEALPTIEIGTEKFIIRNADEVEVFVCTHMDWHSS